MKFAIKSNPEKPYHYIIAVAVHPATSGVELAGQMFLKYRPIHFTNDDIEKLQHAAIISKDKLFETSNSEAFAMVGMTQFAAEFSSFKMASMANLCSLHHFETDFEVDEDDFALIVDLANTSDYFKEKLKNSSIRG